MKQIYIIIQSIYIIKVFDPKYIYIRTCWLSLTKGLDQIGGIFFRNPMDTLGVTFKYIFLNSIFFKCFFNSTRLQKNLVFYTNSNFLFPISLQTDGVNLKYLKLKISRSKKITSLKYQRFTSTIYRYGYEIKVL